MQRGCVVAFTAFNGVLGVGASTYGVTDRNEGVQSELVSIPYRICILIDGWFHVGCILGLAGSCKGSHLSQLGSQGLPSPKTKIEIDDSRACAQ